MKKSNNLMATKYEFVHPKWHRWSLNNEKVTVDEIIEAVKLFFKNGEVNVFDYSKTQNEIVLKFSQPGLTVILDTKNFECALLYAQPSNEIILAVVYLCHHIGFKFEMCSIYKD
jgi:hypothetical protein